MAPRKVESLKVAFLRSAPEKSTPLRFERSNRSGEPEMPEKLAPVRSEPVKLLA